MFAPLANGLFDLVIRHTATWLAEPINDNMAQLPATITIALLTVFISIAVALFNDLKFPTLDRYLIVDHVAKAKWAAVALPLAFVPLLFWAGASVWTRSGLFGSWIAGNVLICCSLINCYHWLKSKDKRFDIRFKYLENLENLQEMQECWSDVWQEKIDNAQYELQYLRIFGTKLDKLLDEVKQQAPSKQQEEELKTINKLLNSFKKDIDERELFNLFCPIHDVVFFNRVLEWHRTSREFWHKAPFAANKLSNRSYSWFWYLHEAIDGIVKRIITRSLEDEGGYVPILFYALDEHIKQLSGKP